MTASPPVRSTPLLPQCDWFASPTPVLPELVARWLHDKRSTTAKLKQLGDRLQIECCFEGWVTRSDLGTEATVLPRSVDSLWLREVLMIVDDWPWLYGRSLIPQPLLEHAELGLKTLGTTPLGERLFNLPVPPQRSDIEVAVVTPPLVLVTRVAAPPQATLVGQAFTLNAATRLTVRHRSVLASLPDLSRNP